MQDNNTFNKDMLSKPLLMPSVPVNPDVRFIQLPFYEEMGEILKATSLLTSHTSSRIQMSHFEFHLTPQQITEISRSRSGFGSKMTYSIQVKCFFLEFIRFKLHCDLHLQRIIKSLIYSPNFLI